MHLRRLHAENISTPADVPAKLNSAEEEKKLRKLPGAVCIY